MFEFYQEFDEESDDAEMSEEDSEIIMPNEFEEKLFQAIEDPEEFDRLLTANRSFININILQMASLSIFDRRGNYYDIGPGLLHLAAYKKQTKVVERLLREPDLDINLFSMYGQKNALHIVAENGCSEIAALLIANKIKVNLSYYEYSGSKINHVKTTALHVACQHGHLPIVKMLLKVPGIDINKANDVCAYLDSPLRTSIQEYLKAPDDPTRQEIVQLLLQAGAGIYQKVTLPYEIGFYPEKKSDLKIDWSKNQWDAIDIEGMPLIGLQLTYRTENELKSYAASANIIPGFNKAIFTLEEFKQAYYDGNLRSNLKSLKNLCKVELEKNPGNKDFKELNMVLNSLCKSLFTLCASFFNKPENKDLKQELIKRITDASQLEKLETLWQEENSEQQSNLTTNNNNDRLTF